ncbi:MAG TPA: hypothetical protein PKW33_15015 [Anaerolineaceae bacterium]|nr:hypothetical protein [Anaerolineaceae bacterium]HPN52903.1 hypothetical protein [Anaerolineaceae bacterium]
MNFEIFATPALVIVILMSMLILLLRDWRWTIASLAIQYLGVFLLVGVYWPFSLAVVKLVVGWMSGAVLGTTQMSARHTHADEQPISSVLFRLVAAAMIILAIFALTSQLNQAPQIAEISRTTFEGSMVLVGMGLLQLGMTAQPFRVVIGLLTVLAGFEVMYSAAESSIMVTGLLAGINLGLAFLGAYFISVVDPHEEEQAE